MADYLKVVAPHLHPKLVSSEALSRLQVLAQTLPPFSLAGFECCLSAEQPRVDFQINVPCLPLNLPDRFLTSPVWQTFLQLFQEWAEPTSLLHQAVGRIGLEFDMDGQPSQVPIPCIFLEINHEAVRKSSALIELAQRLLNHPISSAWKSNLQSCIDSLPDGATITHFGAMLSRSTQAVRVNVEGISPNHFLDYLIQVGWQESTNTLSTLVLTLSELVDNLVLSFDIGETIYPRIGLECFLAKQSPLNLGWQVFLNYLVKNGLCTSAKQKALLAWPGFSQKADNPEVWPKSLMGGDLFLGAKALSVFWRTINLIKIIYKPDSPLEAKAYLAFGHRWFDIDTLIAKKQQNIEVSNSNHELTDKEPETEVSHYLEQVRNYYDGMNPLILRYVGKTYQSGLLTTRSKADPYRETNLYCAERAGIQPGYHILDAGCGVCGPSIDIAQHIERVKIDAITLSPAQANTARELVQQAGLTDRIQIHVGDFHHLPFADEVFDLVFFFESSGYSYDHQRLFSEVYRVLRPGGILYIKEPFSKEHPLSTQEQQELEELNQIYVYKIAKIKDFIAAISATNFQKISSRDLSEILNMEEINNTMFEYKDGFPSLTDFGKIHYRNFKCLPTFFGEIKAYKPNERLLL